VRTPLLIALGIAAVAAAPAAALPPQHDSATFTTAPQVIGQCDGADVVAQFRITLRETVYFDSSGNPSRVTVRMAVRSTITNTATGASVTGTGVRVIREDFGDGTFEVTGSGVHVVVPGAGTLNIEAGLERETDGEYTLTGHRVTGMTPEFCAALAA